MHLNSGGILFVLQAKQVMELMGSSQSTFGDLVSELGFSAAMRGGAEYTLLAPLNVAFSGEQHTVHYIVKATMFLNQHAA